jgi:hypothetical protein
MTTAAATIAGNTPPLWKEKPVTSRGTASTVRASRAGLERRSAYQPRIAEAAAVTAAIVSRTRSAISAPWRPSPSWSPAGPARKSWTFSRVSSECRAAPWSSAVSTTTTDPATTSQPATVT